MAETERMTIEEIQRRINLLLQVRIPEDPPLLTDVADCLGAVNHYFRMKAGMVLECPDAVNLLAVLQRLRRISVPLLRSLRTDASDMAITVGMLAAAGFCDVWPDAISVTPDGEAFIEFFGRKKAEKSSDPE